MVGGEKQIQGRFILSQGLNKKSKHWHFLVKVLSFPQVSRTVTRLTFISIANKSVISGAHVTRSLMQACGPEVETADQVPLHLLKEETEPFR